jgi:hypothetical protein
MVAAKIGSDFIDLLSLIFRGPYRVNAPCGFRHFEPVFYCKWLDFGHLFIARKSIPA